MSGKIAVRVPDESLFNSYLSLSPDGADLTWVDSTKPLEDQAAQLEDAVVIIGDTPVALARQCPNLKLIQVASAGTDRLDLRGLDELGVRVANCGGGNAAAVSEHTIALILSVYRKFKLQFESVRERRWSEGIRSRWLSRSHEIAGKTVGIIGLGHIGQQVARRLRGWECNLVYEDVIDRPAKLEAELRVTRLSRDELLMESDVVTLHVPLLKSTRGLISDRELALMKDTAILINACRGPVVDEAALVRALTTGEIAGAGLDVLEQEPTPADNPLLDMDNVVITPHMASFAHESWQKSQTFAVQNAARVAGGGEPLSVVLPE